MNCPYCRSLHAIEVKLIFKNPPNITNQTVDKWDNGAYYCPECGLSGPKSLIENLDITLPSPFPFYKRVAAYITSIETNLNYTDVSSFGSVHTDKLVAGAIVKLGLKFSLNNDEFRFVEEKLLKEGHGLVFIDVGEEERHPLVSSPVRTWRMLRLK